MNNFQDRPWSWSIRDTNLYIVSPRVTTGRKRRGDRLFFGEIRRLLRSRGWRVIQDPETVKNYRILRNDHYYGKCGDLEFNCDISPASIAIKFYQNVQNIEHSSGGRYEFDMLNRMTYRQRLEWQATVNAITALVKAKGGQNTTERFATAMEHIEADRQKNPHMTAHPSPRSLRDRDKIEIVDGEVRYARPRYGAGKLRLIRGRAYHKCGNMFWLVLNETEYRCFAGFELFKCEHPGQEPRRWMSEDDCRENMQRLKAKAIKRDDLETALRLKRAMTKWDKSDDVYMVCSDTGLYWRPGACGYTAEVTEAGRFSRAYASRRSNSGVRLVPVEGRQ